MGQAKQTAEPKDCPICRRHSGRQERLIKEFEESILVLNEDQFFRGYCFLEYRRHVRELFDLKAGARNRFVATLTRAAQALNALYRPDKMNCELIGNKVPHLHWHLIPRFSSDPAWPEPVWTKVHPPHRLPEAEMERLIEEIRGAL